LEDALKNKFYLAIGACASLALGGCGFGLKVPDIQEGWDSPQDGETLVREISKTVYLSVEKAVVCVVSDDELGSPESRADFAKNWAVQMTLQLTLQETSALSPGLSLNTPMQNGIVNFAGEYFGSTTATVRGPWGGLVSGYPSTYLWGPLTVPQSYSFGLGGKASTQATRTESSGASFPVQQLLQNAKARGRYDMERNSCNNQTIDEDARDQLYTGKDKDKLSKTAQFLSLIVNNDLKIYDWLRSALHIQTIIAEFGGGFVSTGQEKNKGIVGKSGGVGQNAITHEVQFVVVTDGNVTPQWKLVRVSANPTSPFFDTQRQRTHDLIVTFGPKDPKTGKLQSAAESQHNAALYGLSNVNGIRGLFTP
jgi:hypothetical protein